MALERLRLVEGSQMLGEQLFCLGGVYISNVLVSFVLRIVVKHFIFYIAFYSIILM